MNRTLAIITIAVFASIIGVFASSFTVASDVQAAHYHVVVAEGGATHNHMDETVVDSASSIAFGSDDAPYHANNFVAQVASWLPVMPFSLPRTSAPHGLHSCPMTDSNGNTYTVQADDCSTL